jgi:8-oxo-dGTP diphosphatase
VPVLHDSGLALAGYPHPSVAVDTAVLTIDSAGLAVLLVEVEGLPRLPGTFLHEGERLADAVLRSLRDKAGVEGLRPIQLRVFDDPLRDERGWVLSVAHLVVVPGHRLADRAPSTRLCPVGELPAVPWGHDEIIRDAVALIREEYAQAPDPRRLLGDRFTLRELRDTHEAVAGQPLLPDTFRRTMEHRLAATSDVRTGIVGKPARLFERRLSA